MIDIGRQNSATARNLVAHEFGVEALAERDAKDLLEARWQWAGKTKVSMYRCEVSADTSLSFVPLHIDP